jgi:vacuolar-type H+-ATPase subunit E/Vma4
MTSLPVGSDPALAPVRAALASAAAAQVAAIESAASIDAAAALAEASRQRDTAHTAADAAGVTDATAAAALVSARARRVANERILAQQEAIRSELVEHLRTAATQLTTDPRYPGLLKLLRARARRILGPAAHVTACAEGGVTAVAGTRALDLALPTLAEHKLDSMSTEVASLWSA